MMKKYVLIILCLFLTVGCSNEVNKQMDNKDETTEIVEELEPKEEYIDDNPIKVGLYLDGKLVNDYQANYIEMQDMVSFDVYYTNEQIALGNNTKDRFNRYYNNYENIDDYKIGFEISFDVGEEHIDKKILGSDVFALAPYIYVYTYDDIHQADGSWYSHLEPEECNENTILSSIKLFMADGINEVTSPITLKVFTYNGEEDFDEDGHYRGVSSHNVVINKK